MSTLSPRPWRLAALAATLVALTGCSTLQSADNFLGVVTPYRIEIVQGNVVTKEQAEAVRTGMTRAQVRDIFGSPLLADVFHGDRWDYVFTIRRQGAEPQLRRIVLRFDGERLASVAGAENLPSEQEFVASIDTFKPGKAPVLALTADQIKALPVPPKPPVAAAAPESTAPARDYPPLEPGR